MTEENAQTTYPSYLKKIYNTLEFYQCETGVINYNRAISNLLSDLMAVCEYEDTDFYEYLDRAQMGK